MEERKHFLEKVLAVFYFLGNLLKVLGKFIGGVLIRLLAWYKRLWVRFTHNKYEEFVYKRGLAMAAITTVFIILIPTLGMLLFQTAYYLATYKKDSIYLIQSEEIYPDDNTWGVRGCYNQVCDSNSSIYFRIKPSLFHQLWSLSHHGTVFLPDIIGSSVPTGLTKCEIVSYGLRLRILMTFNVYPSILEINCQKPLQSAEPPDGAAADPIEQQ